MVRIALIDYFGFTLGTPLIPKPLPRVVVWGEEFFLRNDEDAHRDCENPRYHKISGHVVDETKSHSKQF